jgi:hypothetical protein
VTEHENSPEPPQTHRSPLGPILLFLGAGLGILMALESIGGLPFDMPRSWYQYRAIWFGAAVACLVAGFVITAPPKGDEWDTQ